MEDRCTNFLINNDNNKKTNNTIANFYRDFFFLQHHVACGVLVIRPGIVPMPSTVEAQSPNYLTTRKLPIEFLFVSKFYLSFNPYNKPIYMREN